MVERDRALEGRGGWGRRQQATAPVWFVLVVSALSWAAPDVHAQDLESITRDLTTIEGQADALSHEPVEETRSPTFVEERLTDGELFYRLNDYVHASIILTDVVEHYPEHAAYPDALFLLSDSLFRAGDYFGSRTRFREIIDHSSESRFRPYVQRALGRLIEIAVHTRDFDGIEEVFAALSRLPPAEIEATTTYFRAKYLYSRAVPTEEILRDGTAEERAAARARIDLEGLEAARQAFAAVAEGSPYYPQALYFIGVIHTLREQYPQAIEAFARVLRTEAGTDEHEDVTELAQLALGRLYYETDQLEQAIEAYQAIPRTSPHFDVALYEIAWVYIRLGDATRAERALEVLTVAAPDSRFIPDGKLLRGNLLLRNGRFEEANEVFREVAAEFGPVRRELDAMIAEHDADPLGYFRSLVRENLDSFDVDAFLPPLAQRWAELEGDMDRAMGVLEDLSEARSMVRETEELVARLEAALNAPNLAVVFADLRAQRERSVALRNRVMRLRASLVGIEEREHGAASGELAEVRARRREIERFASEMPTTEEDFEEMDAEVMGRFHEMERDLANMEVELYGMEAIITATEHYIDTRPEEERTAEGEAAARNELELQRAQVEEFRTMIDGFRVEVEALRIQVGVGDDRYLRHERLREEYAELVEREHSLGGRSDSRTEALYRRLTEVERVLDGHDRDIDAAATARAERIRGEVSEESVNIERYHTELTALEAEAEDVVGTVAYVNFRAVQHRFYDLVLRADVGRIDVAWMQREEHADRVEMLTRNRSAEMQALDDEFREIMDEAGETTEGDE